MRAAQWFGAPATALVHFGSQCDDNAGHCAIVDCLLLVLMLFDQMQVQMLFRSNAGSNHLDSEDKVAHLTSVVMCKLSRTRKEGWHVQAIGDAHGGAADNYGPIYTAVQALL